MSGSRRMLGLLAALVLTTLGCVPATDASGDEVATYSAIALDSTRGAAEDADVEGFDCPVTLPSEGHQAPNPWPAEYPHHGMVWYGTDDLWTALAVDGMHGGRKSVWWSASFPGGAVEEQPEVSVIWTRLDTTEETVVDNDGKATNASTPEEGWFMIAGIDPPEPGCWEVTAEYKGTILSYVYDTRG